MSDESIYPFWRTGQGPWRSTLIDKMTIDLASTSSTTKRCLIEVVDGELKITPISDEEYYK
jgi:hypothetical protein